MRRRKNDRSDRQQRAYRVPRYLAPLVSLRRERVAIETAELDARIPEWFAVVALSRPGTTVIVTSLVARCRESARRVVAGRDARIAGGIISSLVECGPSHVWIVDPRHLNPARLPAVNADMVMVDGADQIFDPPFGSVRAQQDAALVVAGTLPDRSHWFYSWARGEGVKHHTVNAESIATEYPDQRKAMLRPDHYRYERAMCVMDVPERQLPFEQFAKQRLKVRTEKRIDLLSKDQQREAAAQAAGGVVRGAGVAPIVSFELSDVNRLYLAKKEEGYKAGRSAFIVLKGRRMGITTMEQGITYATCVSQPNIHAASISTTGEKVKDMAEVISLFARRDPETRVGVVNRRSYSPRFSNGSWVDIGSSQSLDFGRGGSFQRILCSEVAYWRPGPRHLPEMERFVAGISRAAAGGEIVFESTANGSNWFRQAYEDAKQGTFNAWPIFLRWFDDPWNRVSMNEEQARAVMESLSADEADLVAREKLDAGQIAWRRSAKLELRTLFAQECPEDDQSCFLAAGTCWFDIERIVALQKKTPDYERKHVPGGYYVEWAAPIEGVEYAIGGDTSEGLAGKDRNGFGIIRKDTGEQVAALHGLFRPAVLAGHLVAASKRYNNALIMVERENHGHAVLEAMKGLGCSRPHTEGGVVYFYAPERAGWSTNEGSRAIMLSELAVAIETGAMAVRDRDMLGECLQFRLQSDGKFEADSGAYDDNVMKWAIAWQGRKVKKHRLFVG